MFLLRSTREEMYNILWALVFGFATLNILSLGARRFEREKRWPELWRDSGYPGGAGVDRSAGLEMLYWFGILPIRLTPR